MQCACRKCERDLALSFTCPACIHTYIRIHTWNSSFRPVELHDWRLPFVDLMLVEGESAAVELAEARSIFHELCYATRNGDQCKLTSCVNIWLYLHVNIAIPLVDSKCWVLHVYTRIATITCCRIYFFADSFWQGLIQQHSVPRIQSGGLSLAATSKLGW